MQELFGSEGCEFVDTRLVDVENPAADGAAKHAAETDSVKAHDVSDHVPYPPALTQRRCLPLRGRQILQKISQVRALGGGHLQTIHGITS